MSGKDDSIDGAEWMPGHYADTPPPDVKARDSDPASSLGISDAARGWFSPIALPYGVGSP
jgi:hypothetical protein